MALFRRTTKAERVVDSWTERTFTFGSYVSIHMTAAQVRDLASRLDEYSVPDDAKLDSMLREVEARWDRTTERSPIGATE